MLISEEMEIWDQTVGKALEHNIWENKGIQKGQSKILALTAWLLKNNRMDDVKRITTDPDYLNKVLEEYNATQNANTETT